jgi:LPS sulfotransferase NodH
VQRNYIICTTARSGSNLLCDVLRNTGKLGHPVEAFNPDFMRTAGYREYIEPDAPVSVEHFVEWLKQRHRTRNGIFGTKMLYEDHNIFRRFPSFAEFFLKARIIHLRRRSKLRQAISYFFAEETGQWVATDQARRRPEDVAFDFDAIRNHMDRLVVQDASWTTILNGLGIDYLEIYFEDFLADMQTKLNEIGAYVGAEEGDLEPRVTLIEQANPASRVFLEQFRELYRDYQYAPVARATYKGLEFR